jgi:hypothetical protein
MVNYSNGKIYKIVCDTTKLVYIGSTTKQYLSQRLDSHRRQYKTWKGGKGSNYTSFKVLEGNNYSIVLLELVDCKSKDELLARERFYIETVECVNKFVPLRTQEEEKNYAKEYREVNKDAIYKKLYEKCDCECGGKFSVSHKSRHLTTKRHLDYLAINI